MNTNLMDLSQQAETLSNSPDMVCECEAGTIRYVSSAYLSRELASSSVFKSDASMT